MSTMVVDDGIRVRPLPEINGKTDDDPNHRGEKIQRCNPAHVIHIPQAQAKPKPLFRKKPRSRTYRLATNAVKKVITPGTLDILEFNVMKAMPRGISIFGRTSEIQAQIDDIVRSSFGKPKTLLVLRTTFDPRGAFTTHSEIEQYRHFAKTHSIKLIDVRERRDFHSRLSEDINFYDVIILKAHSDGDQVHLAKDFTLSSISTPEMSQLRMHSKLGGAIVLECCDAAKGGGIARKISLECSDSRVFASKDLISAVNGREYSDQLDPTFYRTEGFFLNRMGDSTVIFRNGARVIILKPI